jgi:hypothetical protein
MRLSWNEIRARAAAFATEWADARYERGETQSFYNEFFEVFGVRRRQVATFEEPVKKLGERQGFIDLFWKGVLLVEQKSAGRNLIRAKEQALDYFPGLKPYELPRYVLLSDFQTFELHDLESNEPPLAFPLADLPRHVDRFGFIVGVERRTFRDQDPANILASELMAKLHDALKDSGYVGHDLERYLVRLLFCLFADDTGIFPRDSFETLIRERTAEDGSDLGLWLAQLWEVLDCDRPNRQRALDEDLQQFDYINGQLFTERLPIASFNGAMRARLLEACAFGWDTISPAIFGSLFQAVMKPAERRKKGAHYTTERNILKVIQPLFLDDLRAEFERLKARRDTRRRVELEAFHNRLAALRFFDPACGCGNFLVITYRELRELETALLVELRAYRADEVTAELDVSTLSRLNVDQFYGIELEEFPARIAEVALWMTDHIANNRLSLAFGRAYARIPLRTAPHIHGGPVDGDALEVDWAAVLPPAECTYIFGNPPFIGAKQQSVQQRAQITRIAALGRSGGTLDYVAAWFLKAGAYANADRSAVRSIGFVATNSITQGEQAPQLWRVLFDRYRLEIAFAHRTFAWGSDARGVAHVHVVIIGLVRAEAAPAERRLFTYADINADPVEERCGVISPYLFDATGFPNPKLTVLEISAPINGAPRLKTGVQMIDDGIMTFTDEDRTTFLEKEPGAAPWFRMFLGGEEYIHGFTRWILYLRQATPAQLRDLPMVRERIERLKKYRSDSTRPQTKVMAAYPQRLGVDERLDAPYLVIPNTSSERRDYIPIGWLKPDVIANQKLRILANAEPWQFALLTSRMHMAWMRAITGRLESRYMYSAGVVYNNFPMPKLEQKERTQLDRLGNAVLAARAAHPECTLADLYGPNMPEDLTRAHLALDVAVDRLYRPAPFGSDRERVKHLFGLYERMVAGFLATPAPAKRRRNGAAVS